MPSLNSLDPLIMFMAVTETSVSWDCLGNVGEHFNRTSDFYCLGLLHCLCFGNTVWVCGLLS